MRPSETRMSALMRPSARTSVPPRTMVSRTMREFQLVQKFQASLERGRHVAFAHVLGRMMADAPFTAEEQHAYRHLRGEHHRIVAGAARHPMGWRTGFVERAIEHRGDRGIHSD